LKGKQKYRFPSIHPFIRISGIQWLSHNVIVCGDVPFFCCWNGKGIPVTSSGSP
jgi:hypothetical protein